MFVKLYEKKDSCSPLINDILLSQKQIYISEKMQFMVEKTGGNIK